MISNRRQIMVLYVNGDIEMWDLLTCKVLRTYPNKVRDTFYVVKSWKIEFEIWNYLYNLISRSRL